MSEPTEPYTLESRLRLQRKPKRHHFTQNQDDFALLNNKYQEDLHFGKMFENFGNFQNDFAEDQFKKSEEPAPAESDQNMYIGER